MATVNDSLYPEIIPYMKGMLDVGDMSQVYWEQCGNPDGKPAVVIHGGPGSGTTPWWRRLFDPKSYRMVLFDQRGCGRSKPHASKLSTGMTNNNTQNLVRDIERLRESLGAENWLVMGGSWGSTLALAYAEAFPSRVTELVLFGVTTGRWAELDWTFRGGLGIFFPEQWERLRTALPPELRDGDVVAGYNSQLNSTDPEVRKQAAEAWCLWESATPGWPPNDRLQDRFTDQDFALAFSRLVTHYVSHNLFLDDGILLRNAQALTDIPGTMVNGRFDFQAPLANALALKRVWPHSKMVVVDQYGHAPTATMNSELVKATDGYARLRG